MRLRLVMMLVLSFLVLAACVAAEEPEPEPVAEPAAAADALPEGDGTRENPFVGRGFISEIGTGELLINHETIPGYMAAMQMAFPVTDDVDLSEFSVGDQVMFDIELEGANGYQVFSMEPVGN